MRICKMAECLVVLEGRNGRTVLLVNTELHDQRGRELYALCIPNDVISFKAQKWQLADLMTASALIDSLSISQHVLPRGVRAISQQFRCMESLKTAKSRILQRARYCKDIRYLQLKCVETNTGGTNKYKAKRRRNRNPQEILEVPLTTLVSLVHDALADDGVELIRIVSIISKNNGRRRKENFSIDYLLPIRIGDDWVGIVYRNGYPSQALMDCYDIANKAILCDPSFNEKRLSWFTNTHHRLRIKLSDDGKRTDSVRSITDSASMQSSPSATTAPSLSNVSQASMPSLIPSLNGSGGSSFDSGISTFTPVTAPLPVFPVPSRVEQQSILLWCGLSVCTPPSPTELGLPSNYMYV